MKIVLDHVHFPGATDRHTILLGHLQAPATVFSLINTFSPSKAYSCIREHPFSPLSNYLAQTLAFNCKIKEPFEKVLREHEVSLHLVLQPSAPWWDVAVSPLHVPALVNITQEIFRGVLSNIQQDPLKESPQTVSKSRNLLDQGHLTGILRGSDF